MMAKGWTLLLLLCLHISQVLCLRCLQCVGSSSTCRMVVRKCQSYETTCISLAYRAEDGSNTVMKGCSTTTMCNQTSIIDIGSKALYMTSTCCESDLCNINKFSTSQVFSNRLTCNTCSSSSLSCLSTQSVFCDQINNYCVDLATTETKNGVTTTSYMKGCGSSYSGQCSMDTSYFAFNTGVYQRYSYLRCCNNQDQCNSVTASIPILSNKNGITCYGCNETGNNECAVEKQKPVECTGWLIRCMEVFDENRRTIMKGCSSVAFCSSVFPSLQVPNVSGIQCCAGNMCNNFTRQTSNSTGLNSSSTRLNTDFRLSAFLIGLLYTIMRHFP
ncbi:urokinase plasminogen activator surface receptor-like [Leptodactylus fuscus]|uniref:urokinase plasminogen activator surface receptor-like n=1 Tax=Leptodactylus fuscus TaxID=238119 RepID=UPI003F4EC127